MAVDTFTAAVAGDGMGFDINIATSGGYDTFSLQRRIAGGGSATFVRGALNASLDGVGAAYIRDLEVPQNSDIQYLLTMTHPAAPFTPYIKLPGAAGNCARTTAAGTVTPTSIEFAVKVRFDAIGLWQPLAGWDSTWAGLTLEASGQLRVYVLRTGDYAQIGGALSSVAIPGLAAGVDIWVKGKVTPSTAVCNYAYSLDATNDVSAVSWTTLGTAVTGTNAGSTPVDGTAQVTMFGARSVAEAGIAGRLYAGAQWINGSLVHQLDTSVITDESASTFTAATGQTVTIAKAGPTPAYVVMAQVTTAWLSASGQVDYGGNVLFDLARPTDPQVFLFEDWNGLSHDIDQETMWPTGRQDPVVVSGVRRWPSSLLSVLTLTNDEYAQLMRIVSAGITCISPRYPLYYGETDGIVYASIGKVTEERKRDRESGQPARLVKLPVQKVNPPPADFVAQTARTWDEVIAWGLSWDALSAMTWDEVAYGD